MGRARGNASGGGIGLAPTDAALEAAQEAGLVYTTDEEPGIRRVRKGKKFEYVGPDGKRIRDLTALDRIRSLAIPPAWDDVWITTRPRGHLQATGRDATVRFLCKGKSGVEVAVGVTDRRVARVIKRCEDLPGQNLFQYLDGDGERRVVTSDDVNGYLREVSSEEFTAKDFRTWAGTVLAACALREASGFESETEAKRKVVEAIDSVARKLGHTRAVCRRSYAPPTVIDTYMDGHLERALSVAMAKPPSRLNSDEAAVLSLLRRKARRKVAARARATAA